ncbi:MAG: acyl transferase domain-containing protein/acyl carrier protein, partial [Myxococcota bacterium]
DQQSLPWLADHQLHGRIVLPATLLLEMFRAAGQRSLQSTAVVVEDVTLQVAAALPEVGSLLLQIVLSEAAQGQIASIYSRGEDSHWIRHATARIHADAAAPRGLPSSDPRGEAVDITHLYETAAARGVVWGPAFQSVTRARREKTTVTASLSLHPSVTTDRAAYALHPAMLDGALQAASLLLDDQEGPLWLPVSFQQVRVFRPGVAAADAQVQRTQATAAGATFDISLVDSAGGPVALLRGVRFQPAPAASLFRENARVDALLWSLDWQDAPSTPGALPPGLWWLPDTASPQAEDLRAALQRQGAHVIEDLSPRSTDAPLNVVWAPEGPHLLQRAVTLAQALVHAEGPVRLWWITHGAIRGTVADRAMLDAAALWGLGRSIQTEHPELSLRLVDAAPSQTADQIVQELGAADGEQQVLLDGALRQVARVQRLHPLHAEAPPLRSDGMWLVTGGTGAVGLHIAQWLVQHHGIRSLGLISRHPPAGDVQETIAALEAMGVSVTWMQADVSDAKQVHALVEGLPLPLRGVVHAAGALGSATLDSLSTERLEEAMGAKAGGAWALHRATSTADLDAFWMVSSIAGPLGAAGQGAYAAANAALDRLAEARRAQGLPALSVSWGPWSGSGMAARASAAARARLKQRGLQDLSPAQATQTLEAARASGLAHVLAVDLDLAAMRRSLPLVPSVWRALLPADRPAPQTASPTQPRSRGPMIDVVRAEVARVFSLADPRSVALDRPLDELGLDSLSAVELRNGLAERLGLTLSATLAYDYPTIRRLSAFLGDEQAPSLEGEREAAHTSDDDVVIIGMACRLPGATTPEQLWQMLCDQVDATGPVPTDRWDAASLYDPEPGQPGRSVSRRGGFLADVAGFDRDLFGLSPRDALTADPQLRLVLESTWEALERAGIDPRSLEGSATGVFLGLMTYEYRELLISGPESLDGRISAGNGGSVEAGRVSYLLGLQGPSIALDTACSSSLVALHLAAQSLRTRESDIALVGGATVLANPTLFLEFSAMRALAPDGRCKTFSADADGVAWAEGCGMLVLKRRADALRDGHRILAVVRGTAVNQDGRSQGLFAPSGPAQQAVIRRALTAADVEPASVSYLEVHGTGTALGDPIEVQAAAAVYGAQRPPDRPLLMSALKSNIGHTLAAAGVAGIIKATLALQHRMVPASLHAGTLNPRLAWDTLPVKVAYETTPLPLGPIRAAVSAFGVGGTNAHVILERGESPQSQPAEAGVSDAMVVLSANTPQALRQSAEALAAHLTQNPALSLDEVAYTLSVGRAALPHRAAMVVRDREKLIAGMTDLSADRKNTAVIRGPAQGVDRSPRVGFLFTGQGSQWPGMANDLYASDPSFASHLSRLSALCSRHLPSPLLELLVDSDDRIHNTLWTQPGLWAFELALAHRLVELGVQAESAVGHSVGEIAAATFAGILSEEDGARLICARSMAMAALPTGGGMLSVVASPEQVRQTLTNDILDDIDLAAHNAPEQSVWAGRRDALQRASEALSKQGLRSVALTVSHAFHSRLMEPAVEGFKQQIEHIQTQKPSIRFFSALTGREHRTIDTQHWVQHFKEPVLFNKTLLSMIESVEAIVEVGPQPVLIGLARRAKADAALIPVCRKNRAGATQILAATAKAYVLGADISAGALWDKPPIRVLLPTTPF